MPSRQPLFCSRGHRYPGTKIRDCYVPVVPFSMQRSEWSEARREAQGARLTMLIPDTPNWQKRLPVRS